MSERLSMREYTPEEAYEKGYADGRNDALRAPEQNKPLTKEQLFNMTGEPVYVVYNDNTPSGWFIASEQWWTSEKGMVGFGDVWNAYARKPKGADQ